MVNEDFLIQNVIHVPQSGHLHPTRLGVAWLGVAGKAEFVTMRLRVTMFCAILLCLSPAVLFDCGLLIPHQWSLLCCRFTIPTMLRSSINKSGSFLSRGIRPLRRSTCSTATLKIASLRPVRSSGLPALSQCLQSRHYAVAAEQTDKGVVSCLVGGNVVRTERLISCG